MTIPKDIRESHPGLSDWSILLGYRGSIAHGMYVPQSDPNSIDDKDIMSVCVPPLEYYFGLKQFGSRGTKEISRAEWDIVIYEVKKFIGLLEKGNPNVLNMLWLQPEHYIYLTDEGRYLIENRDVFTSKKAYRAFSGYAYGQLHRMEHANYQGYMGKKRKAIVDKHGYDTKNAAHLIRLLRMGTEFLNDGVLNVLRHDSTQLLEIKRGEWTLEKVKREAERLFKRIDEAYDKSPLPVEPDREKINRICIDICVSRFKLTSARGVL